MMMSIVLFVISVQMVASFSGSLRSNKSWLPLRMADIVDTVRL